MIIACKHLRSELIPEIADVHLDLSSRTSSQPYCFANIRGITRGVTASLGKCSEPVITGNVETVTWFSSTIHRCG